MNANLSQQFFHDHGNVRLALTCNPDLGAESALESVVSLIFIMASEKGVNECCANRAVEFIPAFFREIFALAGSHRNQISCGSLGRKHSVHFSESASRDVQIRDKKGPKVYFSIRNLGGFMDRSKGVLGKVFLHVVWCSRTRRREKGVFRGLP